jgi:hypothetical protein
MQKFETGKILSSFGLSKNYAKLISIIDNLKRKKKKILNKFEN